MPVSKRKSKSAVKSAAVKKPSASKQAPKSKTKSSAKRKLKSVSSKSKAKSNHHAVKKPVAKTGGKRVLSVMPKNKSTNKTSTKTVKSSKKVSRAHKKVTTSKTVTSKPSKKTKKLLPKQPVRIKDVHEIQAPLAYVSQPFYCDKCTDISKLYKTLQAGRLHISGFRSDLSLPKLPQTSANDDYEEFNFQDAISKIRANLPERASEAGLDLWVDNKDLSPYVIDLSEINEPSSKRIKQRLTKDKPVALPAMTLSPNLLTAKEFAVKENISTVPEVKPQVTKQPVFKEKSCLNTDSFVNLGDLLEKKEFLDDYYKPKPRFSWASLKPVATFMMLALFIIVPVLTFGYAGDLFATKGKVLGVTEAAADSIESSQSELSTGDLETVMAKLSSAQAGFQTAQTEMAEIGIWTKALMRVSGHYGEFKAGENIIAIGVNATTAAQELLLGLDALMHEDDLLITDKLAVFINKLEVILPNLEASKKLLLEIDAKDIPAEYHDKFIQAQQGVPVILNSVKEFLDVSDILMHVLGAEQKRRFLIIFQNSTELRPTGGFMGSFALVDINKGEISNIEIPSGGPYDFQGSLKHNVIAPQPLHLINTRWELQDANWYVDWPTSAQHIMRLYESAGGPTVDGVIATNIFVFKDILKLVGPVAMSEYDLVVDSDNFLDVIQTQVELTYDKGENKPKKIISDLMPIVLERLFNLPADQYLEVLESLGNNLEAKNLMLYIDNEYMQKKISDRNWAGEVLTANKDYLQVVHTNIAGGKTDGVIKEDINLETSINNKGEIINTLLITKTHRGDANNVFTGVKNIDYLRVYVPLGSELISATGFENIPNIYFLDVDKHLTEDEYLHKIVKDVGYDQASQTRITREFGKTVFGNWMQVDVGKTVTVKFVYKLPFTVDFSEEFDPDTIVDVLRQWFFSETAVKKSYYSIIIQKQPGSWDAKYHSVVKLPDNMQADWVYPDLANYTNNQVLYSDTLSTDQYLGFIIKPLTAN